MFKNGLNALLNLLQLSKEKQLQWRENHQQTELTLKQQQLLAEQQITAELQHRSAQIAHELQLLKTQHDAELNQLRLKHKTQLIMLKTQYQQDIKDYQQYLQSLEQLKQSIRQSYSHLPEAVAFTIHHHAKYLLNQMWSAQTLEDKLQQESCFIRFMTTIHQDAQHQLMTNLPDTLPENTLRLLQDDSNKN